jgi:hypothetical protein
MPDGQAITDGCADILKIDGIGFQSELFGKSLDDVRDMI